MFPEDILDQTLIQVSTSKAEFVVTRVSSVMIWLSPYDINRFGHAIFLLCSKSVKLNYYDHIYLLEIVYSQIDCTNRSTWHTVNKKQQGRI